LSTRAILHCVLSLLIGGLGCRPAAEKPPEEPPYESHETGSWPQFGCDAGATCSTTGSLPAQLTMRWTYPLAAPATCFSGLAIQGDHVFVAGRSNANNKGHLCSVVYALDLASGKEAWRWDFMPDIALGPMPTIVKDRVYLHDHGLGCCDLATGKEISAPYGGWGPINYDLQVDLLVSSSTYSFNTNGASTYVEGLSGDGGQKWKALANPSDPASTDNLEMHAILNDHNDNLSLCQGGGLVFVTGAWTGPSPKKFPDGLYALRQADGTVAWTLPGDWGGVSFDGRHLYAAKRLSSDHAVKGVAAEPATLLCLDPDDGKTVWSFKFPGHAHHPPAHGRGVCVVVTDTGALFALASDGPKTGKVLWGAEIDPPFRNWGGADMGLCPPRNSVLALALGYGKNGAVVATTARSIRFYDLKSGKLTGELPWDQRFGQPVNPVIANGWLVANGNQGVIGYGEPPKKPAKKAK
jgi:outer membrane protein assembly factor BamB